MKLLLPLLFVAALPALALVRAQDPAAKAKAETKAATKEKAPVYDEKAVGSEQIAAALACAKRENRRVLVQWGGNWCHWCILLAELEKANAKISKEILYEYDLVKIDVGQFDKHQDLAAKYGAEIKKGVPYLTVLDADGSVVANQETGPLETGDATKPAHDPEKILDFLKSHEAPHVQAQAVYDAALASAQKDSKRVFLHFGAPTCVWCHRLEDWIAKPEIAAVLGKEFVDLKIDIDRMTGGQEIFERRCEGKTTGIPVILFLDAGGNTLAQSGLGNENIGFPAKPMEIAHFRSMLEKACEKLTKDDIAMLVESLTPPKKPGANKPEAGKPTGAN